MQEIYLDDIECPYCERETYCEFWDIEVKPDTKVTTIVTCDECSNKFKIETSLQIITRK